MYYHPWRQNQWGSPMQQQWGYNNWNNHQWVQPYMNMPNNNANAVKGIQDFGGQPFVIDINKATVQNDEFRRAIWTGDYLQVTLMSIGVGEDIGLEQHPDTDQFIRIEEGQGLVMMGDSENHLDFRKPVFDDDAIMIPAGKWHNLINTGHQPLKLYSIYGPPEHPFGTVHQTKADAMAAEEHHSNKNERELRIK
ncbi:cupin domain-containing protein [Filobacillus milosensis]|uniref:Cupin domain-containing protein n=1 Tax=Filobacillus milosensis TaxID=94137 RepID=A0A4Y8IH20_9BACI|nr:cupin domain-containing protein [Filobacillus milosensis]TFB14245.1 cupin domain-containing protein [Filobacillus milosensis]